MDPSYTGGSLARESGRSTHHFKETKYKYSTHPSYCSTVVVALLRLFRTALDYNQRRGASIRKPFIHTIYDQLLRSVTGLLGVHMYFAGP